jgi:hypothetical protein
MYNPFKKLLKAERQQGKASEGAVHQPEISSPLPPDAKTIDAARQHMEYAKEFGKAYEETRKLEPARFPNGPHRPTAKPASGVKSVRDAAIELDAKPARASAVAAVDEATNARKGPRAKSEIMSQSIVNQDASLKPEHAMQRAEKRRTV